MRGSVLIWYSRARFASFLGLVRARVDCNWAKMIKALLQLIQQDNSVPAVLEHVEELLAHLHTLGVFSDGRLKNWADRHTMALEPGSALAGVVSPDLPAGETYGDLRDWKDIPPVVCISLQVPRSALSVFTSMSHADLGTPTIYCFIEGPDGSKKTCYSACQLAFGNVTTSGARYSATHEVSVQEDPLAWKGSSALVVSFYAPAFALLPDPGKMEVALGICETPNSTATFSSTLGHTMKVYGAPLGDAGSVYVSRYAPNQTDFPAVPGFADVDLESAAEETRVTEVRKTLRAEVDLTTGRVKNFVQEVNIESDGYKAASAGANFVVGQAELSPCQFLIDVPDTKTIIPVRYPTMVTPLEIRPKAVTDQSLSLEDVAQVGGRFEWVLHPNSTYPIDFLRQQGGAVNWNMPYLSLRHCPAIEFRGAPPESLGWLDMHVTGMLSARERQLAVENITFLSGPEEARLNLKLSLITIMLHSIGIFDSDEDENSSDGGGVGGSSKQDNDEKSGEKETGPREPSRIFSVENPKDPEGERIIIIPSAVRLDPASRAAVLDCAVLDNLTPKLQTFLKGLQGVVDVEPIDAPVQIWKHALPAWVERCRTWEHRADCEYAVVRSVPLPDRYQAKHGGGFLCSCGIGQFPEDYLDGLPGRAYLQKNAVRAAISPVFWAPFASEPYRPNLAGSVAAGAHRPPARCAKCGRAEAGDGPTMRTCPRCTKTYCSRSCQRADQKEHQLTCK